MSSFGSDFLARIIASIFNGESIEFANEYYLALYNGDPQNGGEEISGQPYYRQRIFSLSKENDELSNVHEITYPIAYEDWGIVSHFGILDNPTGGTLYFFGEFDEPYKIFRGSQVVVKPRGLRIKVG